MTGLTVADALARLKMAETDYARLIEDTTFDIGIYQPDEVDPQTPHARDELYIVGSGTGEFLFAGESKTFSPGDLFFVPAGVEHRFLNFSEDFSAWVVFFGSRPEN